MYQVLRLAVVLCVMMSDSVSYDHGSFVSCIVICCIVKHNVWQAELSSTGLPMMHLKKLISDLKNAQVMPVCQTGIAARRCASNALPYAASTCVEATTGTPSFLSLILSQAGFLDPPPAVYTCAMDAGQSACLTYLAQCSKGNISQRPQHVL